mgnify:CR=1 FL=1
MLHIDPKRSTWIFGAGAFGQSLARAMLAQGCAVAGFVETTPQSAARQGLPVLNWASLAQQDGQAQLAMGIFNRGIAYDRLLGIPASAGFAAPYMPWTLYEQFGQALGWRFWLSPRQFLLDGIDRIASVAQKLADAESVHALYRICAFRLGLDMDFASFLSQEKQYFNALTLPPLQGKAITYVDCGAYNGDTHGELLDQPGISCAQAFLLEPDPDNYVQLHLGVHHRAGRGLHRPTGHGRIGNRIHHSRSTGSDTAQHIRASAETRHRRRRSPGSTRCPAPYTAQPPDTRSIDLPQPTGFVGTARVAFHTVPRLQIPYPPARIQHFRHGLVRRARTVIAPN